MRLERQEHVAALWKLGLKFGLEEDIVFGWHAGILGAVRILASVEMTEEKRSQLRERLSSFIEWMNKVYEPTDNQGPATSNPTKSGAMGAKSLAAKRSLKKLDTSPIEKPQPSLKSTMPTPPMKGPKRGAGPRGRNIQAKVDAKKSKPAMEKTASVLEAKPDDAKKNEKAKVESPREPEKAQ